MKDPKSIVQEGYDKISFNYRNENFDFENSGYQRFLAELEPYLHPNDRILDLGCGCGIPVAKYLSETYAVVGVDISQVQVERARTLVPTGQFICADMTTLTFPPASFEAILSFYAIIHVPVEQQPALFQHIAAWLVDGGYFMAILGHQAWTGTATDWKGAEMYWSHADQSTYRNWLNGVHLHVLDERFVPEGDGGHTLFIAQKRTPED